MWYRQEFLLPELNEPVIGIDDLNELHYWRRTTDGWYYSDSLEYIGHRDTMKAEDSKGPRIWTHFPKQRE